MARVKMALAAVIAVVAIAGCGASSSVKPTAYVKSVCVALGDWRNTIQSAAAALQSSGASSASRQVAKEDYHRFVGSLVTATQRAAASLHAAGSPSVNGGARIATRLTRAFDTAAAALQHAEAQAGRIPTDTAAHFQLGAGAVSNEIRSGLQQIARVTPGQNQQLRAAAAKQPACQLLASG
ncbi:MAG TPA: hypothetical protein VGI50_00070 [Solirubrobacteraceae bacterium]|jgi:hypothetical protein